ncbi:MAG: hypothetical protein ACOC0P_07250 [Planctomycetota bacterium]
MPIFADVKARHDLADNVRLPFAHRIIACVATITITIIIIIIIIISSSSSSSDSSKIIFEGRVVVGSQ